MVAFGVINSFCILTVIVFEIRKLPIGSNFAILILGFSIPKFVESILDLYDNMGWKISQRKLERGGLITKETVIRISFAYLYRIKADGKYLLVLNGRGTGKYQPVGGVYKMHDKEKKQLGKIFHVMDDNKIPIDESSRDDYRLRLKNKYLRKFIKRFDKNSDRETVDNLGREFKEELVDNGIVNWKQIQYRYCGRHITDLHYDVHFQDFELLLFDVVELLPTEEQQIELRQLMDDDSCDYRFASEEEIRSLGVNILKNELKETIGDHTINIIQESEDQLIKAKGYNLKYSVQLE